MAVAALASRRHGVVSLAQLRSAGLSDGQIEVRIRRGHLHRVHRGVYAVGHPALTLEGRWAAAVLAAGRGAALGRRDAAALWRLLERIERPIDVLTARRVRRQVGIAPHCVGALDPAEITSRHGIPVTSVSRTLLDLAGCVPERRLRRAFAEADRIGLLVPAELGELLDARGRGRPGAARLRALLADHSGPVPLTRSVLEYRFLQACRRRGLPDPEVNVRVAGFEVDMLWRAERVIVELDGHAYHGTRAAIRRDHRRDGRLQAAGFAVLRLTHDDVADSIDACFGLLVPLLNRPPRGPVRATP